MTCLHCGTQLQDGALFCGVCGKSVKKQAAETVPQAQQAEPAAQMPEPAHRLVQPQVVESFQELFAPEPEPKPEPVPEPVSQASVPQVQHQVITLPEEKQPEPSKKELRKKERAAKKAEKLAEKQTDQKTELVETAKPTETAESVQEKPDAESAEKPETSEPVEQEQQDPLKPMRMRDWLIVWLIGIIPVAGLVMYLIWSFKKTTNKSKQSFVRFRLILWFVLIAAFVAVCYFFGDAILSALAEYGS